ncbi:MAG: glycosyltransferase [Actinomycetota bacterium]
MTGSSPLIFVTVGTDHHRFDRLIDWIDRWIEQGSPARADVFVQHGTSAAPRRVRGAPYVSPDEMRAMFRDAHVVVCQGGPATIAEARAAGVLPIAIARRGPLGEHVDDHQNAFVDHLERQGRVRTARSFEELSALLDGALPAPRAVAGSDNGSSVEGSVRRFETEVGRLLGRRARRR